MNESSLNAIASLIVFLLLCLVVSVVFALPILKVITGLIVARYLLVLRAA